MCTLLLALQTHPHYRLVALANRDEYVSRRSLPLAPWTDAPEIVGGRDAVRGGTWLGATKTGRWAALTNIREPHISPPADAPSRGHLVANFLRGSQSPQQYVHTLKSENHRYPGFNLIVGTFTGDVWWLCNREPAPQQVTPGIHGLSNARLDTPWPKVTQGCHALAQLLQQQTGPVATTEFLQLLDNNAPYPQDQLPDTGVGPQLERMLSPLRVELPHYGTVSSSILTVDRHGRVNMFEHTWQTAHNRNESWTVDV